MKHPEVYHGIIPGVVLGVAKNVVQMSFCCRSSIDLTSKTIFLDF